jgi:YVTN family beta-propeller protein
MARKWLIGFMTVAAAAGAVWLGVTRGATAVAAAGAPKVYVGLFKDDAVGVLDPAQGRLVATIPVPKGPHGLVMTPDGRKVYVSSDGASTVSVIDTSADRIVGSIEVGANPHGLAMSRDGRRVLVAGYGGGETLVVDVATDRITTRIPVARPHNLALSPDGRRAYVASQSEGAAALVTLDLEAGREVARLPLDKTPRAVDASPDGRRVFFTLAGVDAVQVLDVAEERVIAQIPVGASPHQAIFTADGRLGAVVSQGPGELAFVDVGRGTVARTVKVGALPHWTAVSVDGRTAVVANEGSNDVSIVDVPGGRVVATIAAGHAPRKIAVQPGALATAAPSATPRVSAKTVRIGEVSYADHGSRDVSGRREVHLEADDYYFKPTFLRGKPGQTLTLEVENESGTLHNLTVPGLGIDRDLAPKSKVKLAVTFPASGIIAFHCKLHQALGMNGQLQAGSGG